MGRRFVALVAGLALAFVALGGLGVWQAHDSARRQVAEQILGTTRALARVVDFEFARTEALLHGLALLPSLRAGDLDAFAAEMRAAAAHLDLSVLGVLGPDGRQRTVTLGATGGVTVADGPPAPEALRVLATGRPEVGDFVEGATSGRRRIVVAVPVAGGGERAAAALGGVFPRERLTAALVDQRLPEGWVAAVLDGRRTVVARTRREDAVVGLSATAPVREGLDARPEGLLFGLVNQDGERSVVGYARAPRSGYAVALAAPEAAFEAARRAALARLAALALPVFGVALLLSLALRRDLARSLRGLASAGAGAAARGPAVARRLREVEEIAAALDAERAARDRVEAELRERTAWFEAAQQAAQVGVWERDLAAGRSRWSPGMRRILGLPPGEEAVPPEEDWLDRVHPDDRARVAAAERAQLPPGGAPFREEFRVATAAGEVRWVRSQGAVERDDAGRPLRVLGAWIDVTARRALEAEREAIARQRDLLASEIHHRVRNSLQLVLGLLVMQARRAPPGAAEALRDAASRVSTIANVHRRLYEDGPDAAGDLATYLGGLARDLHASIAGGSATGGTERGLRLALQPGVVVGPERLPAIGIVVAELMTNAFKYGAGAVGLVLRQPEEPGGEIELAVEDEGPGLPPGFDPARAGGDAGSSRGLGMRVVTTLARQLGGRLEVDRGARGGRLVLRLPPAGPPAGAAPGG